MSGNRLPTRENSIRPQVWLLQRGLARRRVAAKENPASSRRAPNAKLSFLGAGIKVKVNVLPKLGQLTLAIATLIFIGSVDLLVFTVLTVGPGRISGTFEESSCRVSDTIYYGNTYCYVTSLKHHGKIMTFPCLQVYVKKITKDDSNDSSINLMHNPLSNKTEIKSAFGNQQPSNFSRSSKNAGVLMFENELYLAGEDYKHRPCSFLPYYCSGNTSEITQQIVDHANEINKNKNNFSCYFNDHLDMLGSASALRHKTINKAKIIHAITWPIAGMIGSLIVCGQFWNHNKDHISRLFVYNSWSLS